MIDRCLQPLELVQEFMLAEEPNAEEKAKIVSDFHLMNFDFCQKEGFEAKKIACFLELMNKVLHDSLENRFT